MTHLYEDTYPYLDALVGGWFHQDFDINGRTIEDGYFRLQAANAA